MTTKSAAGYAVVFERDQRTGKTYAEPVLWAEFDTFSDARDFLANSDSGKGDAGYIVRMSDAHRYDFKGRSWAMWTKQPSWLA